jgi:ribonuclease HI|tara:strand:- start:1131 stop:1574 length:444 start_codon:yes stop_codon:yes gene_type:complete
MSCKIYTDGSCIGNPGKGGWAAIIIKNGKKKIISGSENYTTNNRMEIIAVIKALNTIKLKQATLITDSQYVKNGIEVWIHKWKDNGWMTAEKKPVKNKDLWTKLDKIQKTKKIKWEWVKGHSSDKLNNEVDRIARERAESIGYSEKI